MTLLPLPVFPHPPTPAQTQAIRAAKAALDLPFTVQIVPAVPGSPVRVLAFEAPDFLCDYALVTNPANLEVALKWVLSDDVDERATLIIDQLRAIFGPDVREVFDGPHFE